MKTGLTLLFVWLGLALNTFAQKSMDKMAASWKDGEYDAYEFSGSSSSAEWTLKNEKVKIRMIKSPDGMIDSIYIGSKLYLNRTKGWSDFVRFYSEAYSEVGTDKIYISDNSIVRFTYDIDNSGMISVKIPECYGKKTNGKIRETIKVYLDETKDKGFPKSFEVIKLVKDIEVIPYSKKESGKWQDGKWKGIGLKLILSDGREIYTSNLGGSYFSYHFKAKSNAIYEQSPSQTDEKYKCNCHTVANNEMEIEIELNDRMNPGKETKNFKKKLAVDCDSYSTPEKELAMKWMIYDTIMFSIWNEGDSDYDYHTLSKSGDNSYLMHSKTLFDKINNAKDASEELILVKKKGKYGYVDFEMKEVIPCEYNYGRVGKLNGKSIPVLKNGKCGLIDYNNKVVYPFELSGLGEFRAGVTWFEKDGKYGYINQDGKIIVSATYKKTYNFHLTGVGVVQGEDGKFGLVDANGKIVMPAIHNDITFMNSHLAKVVKVYNGSKYALASNTGKILTGFDFIKINEYVPVNETEGTIVVKREEYNYSPLRQDGTLISKKEYSYMEDFKDGKALFHSEEFMGNLLLDGTEEKIKDWSSSSDDYSDSNTSSNSGSSNSSGSKTNSSSSGSSSDEKGFTGNVYFKYDMMGKDRPGEKLYIHSGSNASTINSTTPGSNATVKCEKGKVYYSFTGKKSDMKEFMELSTDDCGKTFKYTDFK